MICEMGPKKKKTQKENLVLAWGEATFSLASKYFLKNAARSYIDQGLAQHAVSHSPPS